VLTCLYWKTSIFFSYSKIFTQRVRRGSMAIIHKNFISYLCPIVIISYKYVRKVVVLFLTSVAEPILAQLFPARQLTLTIWAGRRQGVSWQGAHGREGRSLERALRESASRSVSSLKILSQTHTISFFTFSIETGLENGESLSPNKQAPIRKRQIWIFAWI
jgi:hypothetical protein